MEQYTIAIGHRRAEFRGPLDALAARLMSRVADARAGGGVQRIDAAPRWVLGDLVTARSAVALLEAVAREPEELAICWWVGRPAGTAVTPAVWLPKAAASAACLAVAPTLMARSRREAISGLLRMYLALSRGRTEAQWRTLDAVRASRTQAAAASALGCSHQAVSRGLQRAHAGLEDDTAAALTVLAEPIFPTLPAPSAASSLSAAATLSLRRAA